MRYFSRLEMKEILISLAVLSFLFSYPEILYEPAFFLVSLAVLGIAFIGHELAHKFTAIRYGCWSEYRMWPQGLFMAFILALVTNGSLIFAAPGAVYFRGGLFSRPSQRSLTRISMAGITFNIAASFISLLGLLLTGFAILSYMAMINAWLAVFNLIPISMLDGHKLFRLNRTIWAALFILAGLAFFLSGNYFLLR